MNVDPARTPRRRRRSPLALAVWLALVLLAACDRAHEPAITPARVVMPADTAASASSTEGTATNRAPSPTIIVPTPPSETPAVAGSNGNGSGSVIASPPLVPTPAVAPAPALSVSPPTSVGVPPAPPARLPGAARIGPAPASGSTSDQPPSVSPGTKS